MADIERVDRGVVVSGIGAPYRGMQVFRRDAGWAMAVHAHRFCQVILVTDGVLTVHCGQTVWQVGRGQAHILPPGCMHALCSAQGYEQLGLDVDMVDDGRGLAALLRDYVSQPVMINCPETLGDAAQLMAGVAAVSRIESARRAVLLDALLIKLLTAHTRAGAQRFDMRLSEYIDGCLGDSLSLEDVAAEFHMSVPQLERMTRRHFGSSVMELRSQRRMAEAQALLLSSSLSVAAIAQRLGFCDQSHFGHFFRKRCGESPGRYRARALDGGQEGDAD